MDDLSARMYALGSAPSEIREAFEYGRARAAIVGAEQVFDFSIGNPNVPTPQSVTAGLRALLEEDAVSLHGYTSAQGDAAARAKLAENLNARFGTSYDADCLYLTSGAAGALCCALGALSCPGDEFLTLAPYFPEYKVFVESAGAALVVVPPEPEAFQIDFAALEARINQNTKGMILNSPNNPSGVVYSEETLRALARLLEEKSAQFGRPIWLISDEPYREIYYGAGAAPWIPSYYTNTLVCYSFSKSLSLPGARIGYLLVPHEVHGARRLYTAVAGAGRALGHVCAPSLFQRLAANHCHETADLSIYRRNRDLLMAGLREVGFHCVAPEGAFYLFPRSLEPDARAFCLKAREFDLLLVPGDSFGAPGHFRLSYCVPTKRVEDALPRFAQLAKAYR